MRLFIFTVYDSAAEAYLEPFFAQTVEVALRMFRQIVNEKGHQFNKYPEDYTLFHIGEMHQATGQITGTEPFSLGVAITFVDRSSTPTELKMEAQA